MCSATCVTASGSRSARPREKPMRRPAPATVRRLILVLILVLWEAVPRTGLLAELFLPSLSKTLAVLVQNFEEYGEALLVTLYEVALAMAIACGGGSPVGALAGGL